MHLHRDKVSVYFCMKQPASRLVEGPPVCSSGSIGVLLTAGGVLRGAPAAMRILLLTVFVSAATSVLISPFRFDAAGAIAAFFVSVDPSMAY